MDSLLSGESLKRHQNFTVAAITLLSSSSPKPVSGPLSATFGSASGFPELKFFVEPEGQHSIHFDLRATQVCFIHRLFDSFSLCLLFDFGYLAVFLIFIAVATDS